MPSLVKMGSERSMEYVDENYFKYGFDINRNGAKKDAT